MRFPEDMVEATVVRRLNRFVAEVLVDGVAVPAHLANTGRARELLVPGTVGLLVPRPGPRPLPLSGSNLIPRTGRHPGAEAPPPVSGSNLTPRTGKHPGAEAPPPVSGSNLTPRAARLRRKTHFDLALVRLGRAWVSADARLPNRLTLEALREGRIGPLCRYAGARAEVRFGGSRVDFLLGAPPDQCLLEAKSVTLVEGGVALFPDAPTVRGRRHLMELIEARGQGMMAAVLFVVQRPDARALPPHDEADPAFGRTLREAAGQGVMVLAYRCEVSPMEIRIAEEIPVEL